MRDEEQTLRLIFAESTILNNKTEVDDERDEEQEFPFPLLNPFQFTFSPSPFVWLNFPPFIPLLQFLYPF